MDFLEAPPYPKCVAVGATVGIISDATIITVESGARYANENTGRRLRTWNVGHVARKPELMEELQDWFEVLDRLVGFRMHDHTDYSMSVARGVLGSGVGDGSTRVFQIGKRRTIGSLSYIQDIIKPIAGTVKPYVNAAPQTSGFAVDHTTGLVSFASAPAAGALLTCAADYHKAAHFEDEAMNMLLIDYKHQSLPSIPIVEYDPRQA